MAIRKNINGNNWDILDKRPSHDGLMQGEEQLFVDPRDQYDAIEHDWRKHITTQGDCNYEKVGCGDCCLENKRCTNDPVIPVNIIEQIIVENEQLRESLYARQNASYYRNMLDLINKSGNSTSEVIKIVRRIHIMLNKTIKEQDIFRLLYRIIESNGFDLSFKTKPHNISKLQWCYQQGMLPIISMHLNVLMHTTHSLNNIDFKATRSFYDDLLKKLKGNVKKP
jgi:hypothetical protein